MSIWLHRNRARHGETIISMAQLRQGSKVLFRRGPSKSYRRFLGPLRLPPREQKSLLQNLHQLPRPSVVSLASDFVHERGATYLTKSGTTGKSEFVDIVKNVLELRDHHLQKAKLRTAKIQARKDQLDPSPDVPIQEPSSPSSQQLQQAIPAELPKQDSQALESPTHQHAFQNIRFRIHQRSAKYTRAPITTTLQVPQDCAAFFAQVLQVLQLPPREAARVGIIDAFGRTSDQTIHQGIRRNHPEDWDRFLHSLHTAAVEHLEVRLYIHVGDMSIE